MRRGRLYYFGGGHVASLNDLHVPAGAGDDDNGGADPVTFDEPGGGPSAAIFRAAEGEIAQEDALA